MNFLPFNLGSFFSRFSYGPRLTPGRDWSLLLTLSMLVLVAVGAWSLWAFSTVVNGGVLGGVATSTPPVFSQTSLDTIRTLFSDRAAEDTKYQDGTYRYSDPSQ